MPRKTGQLVCRNCPDSGTGHERNGPPIGMPASPSPSPSLGLLISCASRTRTAANYYCSARWTGYGISMRETWCTFRNSNNHKYVRVLRTRYLMCLCCSSIRVWTLPTLRYNSYFSSKARSGPGPKDKCLDQCQENRKSSRCQSSFVIHLLTFQHMRHPRDMCEHTKYENPNF